MAYDTDRSTAILERTPQVLRTLLTGLPGSLLLGDEGEDTFSPYAVVGHLISGEQTDWIPRMRTILEHGVAVPFEPFDRFAFRNWEARPINEMLNRFETLRRRNLDEVKQAELTPDRLELRGTHPDLGEVTLGQLIATWAVHDLNHIGQISRVLAKQFGAQVGPWREYLPVLSR